MQWSPRSQIKKVALGHKNLELLTKLRDIQREVHPRENEWKTEVNALECHSVKAEQAEKEACYEKIRKLENLVTDTEERRAPEHEDAINKVRKMDGVSFEKDAVIVRVTNEKVALEQKNLELKGRAQRFSRARRSWRLNALEDSVKAELGEKDACYDKKKGGHGGEVQEDSENTELLIVQYTELQVCFISWVWFERDFQKRKYWTICRLCLSRNLHWLLPTLKENQEGVRERTERETEEGDERGEQRQQQHILET